MARKPRCPTGKARVVGRSRIERGSDLGIFLRPKSNPRLLAETGPSSWDTSVFVPESSRIDVLAEPENASGSMLLKQAVGSLQYCGTAARPDCRSTSATARLGWRTAKQFFFRGCSTSFSPWRFSAIAYTLTPVRLRQRPRTRTPSCAILPLACELSF